TSSTRYATWSSCAPGRGAPPSGCIWTGPDPRARVAGRPGRPWRAAQPLPARQADVQPGRGAGRAAPRLDQVADMVHHPQPLPGRIRRRPLPPGHRVGDPFAVVYLADDLLPGCPDLR